MKFINAVALLLILPSILAKKRLKCIDGTKPKLFRLSCKSGVIYKPYVSEDVGTCKKKTCSGLSGVTLGTRNNCYWKKSCQIQMQLAPMVTKCFRVPQSMTVHSGFCIPNFNDITRDICEKNSRMDSINDRTMIIRSHSHYPWNYDYLTFNKSDGTKECQIKSSLRADDVSSKNMMLAVTVEDVDIDTDMDDLWFQYGTTKYAIHNRTTFAIVLDKLDDIVLIFRTNGFIPYLSTFDITGPALTKGGRGFIICLKVLRNVVFDSTKSVCDDVIKKGLKIRKKSLRKRNKNKPKKRKSRKVKNTKSKNRKNKNARG